MIHSLFQIFVFDPDLIVALYFHSQKHIAESTEGKLYDRIHYYLYLNKTHSSGVSLQLTKEK
jgi:hypothetical protein